MYWLIYVAMNIKNVLLELECRYGDVYATDQCRRQKSSVTLQLTHRTDSTSNDPHPMLVQLDSLPHILKQIYWGQGCSVDRNLEFHTSLLLRYCTFGLGAANDAQSVRADTARRKDNDQQNLSKMIIWYRSVYNQIASDAWRYNNPVYKLMTDKLQLMLINVLLDRFLNI